MNDDRHSSEFEESIGRWIGKTSKLMEYYLHEAICRSELDISKEQMLVLKTLDTQDGLNQKKLAALTYRDKSSLARLLSKMESKKYIFRRQSNSDKRNNHVFLTAKGRTILQRTRPLIQELMRIMEHNFTVQEKQDLIQLLKKVQLNFTSRTLPL